MPLGRLCDIFLTLDPVLFHWDTLFQHKSCQTVSITDELS